MSKTDWQSTVRRLNSAALLVVRCVSEERRRGRGVGRGGGLLLPPAVPAAATHQSDISLPVASEASVYGYLTLVPRTPM